MRNRIYIFLLLLLICATPVCANEFNGLSEIKVQIDNEQYDKAIESLNRIEGICLSDTSSQVKMKFNLYKGCSLYFLKDYSNAIPYLKEAEQYMRFSFNSGDCNYLETLYGIASCYKKTDDFMNAEKYYRKAIIADEVQSFACNIMKQVYADLIELYRSNGRESLADECNTKLEQYNNQLLGHKMAAKGNWQEQVEELFDDLPDYNNTFPQDRDKIVTTYNSILNVIETNVGKCNDDYIMYCSLYEMTMQYRVNDTIVAIDLCKCLFDIGRNMSVHKPEIATAYTDFLRMVSRANDVVTIEKILPEAIEYYNATVKKNRGEENLYEIIGIGLYDAGNKEIGVKYLEKLWNGKECTAIVGLIYIADYYYLAAPEKALTYLKKAEYQSSLRMDTSNETKLLIQRSLMSLYEKLGNNTDALLYANKVTPLIQNQDVNQFAQHLTNCAVLQGRLNDFRGVQNNFQQIEKLYSQLSSETKVYYLSNKGFICLICNKTEDAVQALLQAQDIAISNFGENSYQLETIYHNLGRAYMMLSNYKQALNWLGKSRDLQLKNNGSVMERTEKYIKECNEL